MNGPADISTGLESSGSGNIEFTATNSGNSPIVTTVTVTPTFENDGNSNLVTQRLLPLQ